MMSQDPRNPYAAAGGYDDIPIGGMTHDGPPERISVMAVFSLLCSVPCCVIPGLGLVGIALGAAALAAIRKNAGRLSGRGLAIAGIILGVIVTAMQLYVFFGALEVGTYYVKQMAPTTERFVAAAVAGDIAVARAELSTGADADLTDERIAAFTAAVVTANGQFHGVATSVGTFFESFGRVRGGGGNAGRQPGVAPVPIALEFDSGPALAWVLFDEQTVKAPGPKIADILVFLPNTGDAVTLRENGPAAAMAQTMNIRTTPVTTPTPATSPPPADQQTPEEPNSP